MKYLLFGGYDYHPQGGWCDFIKSSDSIDDLKKIANEFKDWSTNPLMLAELDWWHILDSEVGVVVVSCGMECYDFGYEVNEIVELVLPII